MCLDAVGAAMGIACLCRKKGKPFHIVLDLENNSAEKLIEEIDELIACACDIIENPAKYDIIRFQSDFKLYKSKANCRFA